MGAGISKVDVGSKLDNAFNDKTYSDLTVVTGGVRFHVHKVILSLYTPYFTNATRHIFSEAAEDVVTINEPSPHAVYRVLKYCYSGELPEHTHPELGQDEGPLMLPRIFALADMLCIDELKAFVSECIKAQLEQGFVVTDFLEIVGEVYATTNDTHTEIRSVLVNTAVSQMDSLVGRSDFRRLMEEFGEFSSALVIAMHDKHCSRGGSSGEVCSFITGTSASNKKPFERLFERKGCC